MGGKAHGGRRVSREEGLIVAGDALQVLMPHLEKYEVCGSIRRGKPDAGDVDLVVVPKAGAELALEEALRGMFGTQVNKKAKHSGLVDGVQVDVVVSTPEGYGAAQQFFTGSALHNITLRRTAKAQGLLMNEKGIYRRTPDGKAGEKLAGATEESMYAVLGMEMPVPAAREVV